MKSWYGLIARSLNKRKSMSSHKTTFFVRSWVYINVMFIQRVICSTNVRQTRYKMTVITTWQHLTIVIQNSLNFHSVITSYNAFIITFNFSTQSHVCTHCCSYLYVLTCTFLSDAWKLFGVCVWFMKTHSHGVSFSLCPFGWDATVVFLQGRVAPSDWCADGPFVSSANPSHSRACFNFHRGYSVKYETTFIVHLHHIIAFICVHCVCVFILKCFWWNQDIKGSQ